MAIKQMLLSGHYQWNRKKPRKYRINNNDVYANFETFSTGSMYTALPNRISGIQRAHTM